MLPTQGTIIVAMEKKDFILWVRNLQVGYRPSDEVVSRIAQVDLIALVGPTGVGKSTLMDQLDMPDVLSDVTRDPRPGEKNGKNYHFKNDYLKIIYEIKSGNYVQFLIEPNGEFYGTHIKAYPESGPCCMAVVSSEIDHCISLGFRSLTSFYVMPPSYIEWMRRIGGVRAKDLLSRIGEARQSLLDAVKREDYHFVLNDTLELAVKDIKDTLNGSEVNQHRVQLARGTADILLERIGDDESDM
jgi:guanylate kinase